MPSDIRLPKFKRWFTNLGCTFEFKSGKGSHFIISRLVGEVEYVYTVPTRSGRYVKHIYLAKTRKALKFTTKDGYGDEHFS